jgi:hypothetical protein
MRGYTECPNCVQDRIIVPLKKEGSYRICPLCESIYHSKIPNINKISFTINHDLILSPINKRTTNYHKLL